MGDGRTLYHLYKVDCFGRMSTSQQMLKISHGTRDRVPRAAQRLHRQSSSRLRSPICDDVDVMMQAPCPPPHRYWDQSILKRALVSSTLIFPTIRSTTLHSIKPPRNQLSPNIASLTCGCGRTVCTIARIHRTLWNVYDIHCSSRCR